MQYSKLLHPFATQVAEQKSRYHYISERHVQAIWFEQKYFKSLKTVDGQPIEVISPGIWNAEAGPDFLKAHIRLGEEEFRGDVEIHLNDEGWCQHRHHLDERYNNVILHISLWSSTGGVSLMTKEGIPLSKAHLEPFLTVSTQRLLHLIDLDLYPYKKFIGSGACSKSLFKGLSKDKIEDFFISASYWRLERKKQYLSAHFKTEPLQFIGGVAIALGYKNNAENFLELFTFLLGYQDLEINELLGLALGCSGFFDRYRKEYWEESAFYKFLMEIWRSKFNTMGYKISLQLDHIRPLNSPIRRLAYLVQLIKNFERDAIFENLIQIWERREGKSIKLRNELIEALPDYQTEYWARHFTFESTARDESLSLLGKDLRATILINSFLPLLCARIGEGGTDREKESFQELYSSFIGSKAGKSDYLVHRFFGDAAKGQLLRKAQIEQGAFQLHKDFCVHFEASCEGCLFVDRYQEFFGK